MFDDDDDVFPCLTSRCFLECRMSPIFWQNRLPHVVYSGPVGIREELAARAFAAVLFSSRPAVRRSSALPTP